MLTKACQLKSRLKDLVRNSGFFTSIEDRTMGGPWRWAISTWICVFVAVVFVSPFFSALVWISQGVFAIHLAKWIRNIFKYLKPKRFIQGSTDKVVFITGCDSGFGYELALKLDAIGFKVFAGCFDAEGSGAEKLRSISENIKVVHIDVTNDALIAEASSAVSKYCDESNGSFWALVNNAGAAVMNEVELCSTETYQKMVDVNAIGVIRTTKSFLPLLRKQGRGRVIITASLAGRIVLPCFSAYSVSKHAVIAFADGLRMDMKKWGITVHTIEPTLYRTPMTETTRVLQSIEDTWDKCPEDVKQSYGREYLEDFKLTVNKRLSASKPTQAIHEVVDDLVYCVAGEDPEQRYVPSLATNLRWEILNSIPKNIQEEMLFQMTPKTPPADIDKMRTKFKF